MTKDLDTEGRVLEAAKRVFIRKGYAGARMQEIADEAGINKGLLHYYFKSKDNLFSAIFEQAFREMVPRQNELFESDLPLFIKLEQFVERYLDFFPNTPTCRLSCSSNSSATRRLFSKGFRAWT
ncbi:MAG: TetR/AcrR family transcriptional regulator [Saprospirales bacterium]|nr:TetR/AcrR family transcriptional regulator [Saprospirales bacterium]